MSDDATPELKGISAADLIAGGSSPEVRRAVHYPGKDATGRTCGCLKCSPSDVEQAPNPTDPVIGRTQDREPVAIGAINAEGQCVEAQGLHEIDGHTYEIKDPMEFGEFWADREGHSIQKLFTHPSPLHQIITEPSEELIQLAGEALERMKNREPEDIKVWAKRLGEQLCADAANDPPTVMEQEGLREAAWLVQLIDCSILKEHPVLSTEYAKEKLAALRAALASQEPKP